MEYGEVSLRSTEAGKLEGDHHENELLITVNLDCETNRAKDIYYAIRQLIEKDDELTIDKGKDVP